MTPHLRPDLARRLVWEAAAVEAAFPGRMRLWLDALSRPTWRGSVPVEGRDFPVLITCPTAYPAVPPLLQAELEVPATCPHVIGRDDGRTALCWIAVNGKTPRRRWDPARHTAATVLRAAQRWGLAYLVWQATGDWPVPDAFGL